MNQPLREALRGEAVSPLTSTGWSEAPWVNPAPQWSSERGQTRDAVRADAGAPPRYRRPRTTSSVGCRLAARGWCAAAHHPSIAGPVSRCGDSLGTQRNATTKIRAPSRRGTADPNWGYASTAQRAVATVRGDGVIRSLRYSLRREARTAASSAVTRNVFTAGIRPGAVACDAERRSPQSQPAPLAPMRPHRPDRRRATDGRLDCHDRRPT
jgi:hypothetical protein